MSTRSFLALVAVLFISHSAADGIVTITRLSSFDDLRPCIYSCLGGGGTRMDGGYRIASAIECQSEPPMNNCFCRADLQPQAAAFLTSCVNFYCSSNAKDLGTAVGMYKNYCTKNGYSTTNTATITGSGTAERTSQPSTSRSTTRSTTDIPQRTGSPIDQFLSAASAISGASGASSTPTASPASEQQEDKKLSGGEIAGVVVGILGLIVASITLMVNWKTLRQKVLHTQHSYAEIGAPVTAELPRFEVKTEYR